MTPDTTESREERKRIVRFLEDRARAQYHVRYTIRDRLFMVWTAMFWPENLFSGCWQATAKVLERGEHWKDAKQ